MIEHWKTWPEFHNMTEGSTVNYENPFLVLMHDEIAYQNMFGEEFPSQKEERKKFHEQNNEDESNEYPIVYLAERLPIFAKDEDEHYENIFKLLEILAETEQLAYFRCGYVTRLIDWMWDS